MLRARARSFVKIFHPSSRKFRLRRRTNSSGSNSSSYRGQELKMETFFADKKNETDDVDSVSYHQRLLESSSEELVTSSDEDVSYFYNRRTGEWTGESKRPNEAEKPKSQSKFSFFRKKSTGKSVDYGQPKSPESVGLLTLTDSSDNYSDIDSPMLSQKYK